MAGRGCGLGHERSPTGTRGGRCGLGATTRAVVGCASGGVARECMGWRWRTKGTADGRAGGGKCGVAEEEGRACLGWDTRECVGWRWWRRAGVRGIRLRRGTPGRGTRRGRDALGRDVRGNGVRQEGDAPGRDTRGNGVRGGRGWGCVGARQEGVVACPRGGRAGEGNAGLGRAKGRHAEERAQERGRAGKGDAAARDVVGEEMRWGKRCGGKGARHEGGTCGKGMRREGGRVTKEGRAGRGRAERGAWGGGGIGRGTAPLYPSQSGVRRGRGPGCLRLCGWGRCRCRRCRGGGVPAR